MRTLLYLTLISILIIAFLEPCISRHRKHHARVIKQAHKKNGTTPKPSGSGGPPNSPGGTGGGAEQGSVGDENGGEGGENDGQSGGGKGAGGPTGNEQGKGGRGGGKGGRTSAKSGRGGGADSSGGSQRDDNGGNNRQGGGEDGDCEEPPPPIAQGARYLGYAADRYWWITEEASCKEDVEDICQKLYPNDDGMITNLATGDITEGEAISKVLEEGGVNEPVWTNTIKKLNEDRKMMLYKFGSHGLRIEDPDDEIRSKRSQRQALVTRTLYKQKVKKRHTRQVEVKRQVNSVEVEAVAECDDNGMMIPNMEVHYPWIETWENGTPCVDTSSCHARMCNVTTDPCMIENHPTCQIMSADGEARRPNHNDTATCTIINSGECTVVCERCDIVTEPECWAAENKCEVIKERQCTMSEPTCNVTMQPCSVTRPPCVTKQEPCEVNSTNIIECQMPEECATPQGVNCTRVSTDCQQGQSDKECTRMECVPLPICLKPEYCRQTENGTLKVLNCPPPTTFCPPEIVSCPAPSIECTEPVWKCTDPEIYCPPPQVICTQPVVNCTAPTISCPNVITTCQNPNITCGKPQYFCPEPQVVCEEMKNPCLVKPDKNIPMCKVDCNPEDDCSCMKLERSGDTIELSEQRCEDSFPGLCTGAKIGDTNNELGQENSGGGGGGGGRQRSGGKSGGGGQSDSGGASTGGGGGGAHEKKKSRSR